MNNELFRQIINSGWLGTALLVIAVALWIIVFRLLEEKKTPPRSSGRLVSR